MHPLRLIQPVTIRGKDYFGRSAWIQFQPTQESGWFWLYDLKKDPIPITSDIVFHSLHRLTLKYGKARLEIYEHIGALRWIGLDGVIISSTTWPPYHGRTQELWQIIKNFCQTEPTTNIPWFTIYKSIRYEYKNGRNGFLKIQPYYQPGLDITIISDYPGLGCEKIYYCITPLLFPEFVFRAYAQGWPAWTYYLSRFLSCLGWPHHDAINWPQKNNSKKTIHQFAIHRLSDLLGALSLVHPSGFLAANVVSYCAGHEADVELLKQIKPLLVPFEFKTTLQNQQKLSK